MNARFNARTTVRASSFSISSFVPCVPHVAGPYCECAYLLRWGVALLAVPERACALWSRCRSAVPTRSADAFSRVAVFTGAAPGTAPRARHACPGERQRPGRSLRHRPEGRQRGHAETTPSGVAIRAHYAALIATLLRAQRDASVSSASGLRGEVYKQATRLMGWGPTTLAAVAFGWRSKQRLVQQ